MTNSLSHRVNRIEASPTMALNSRVKELKDQGQDIINLTVGEPDFDTPDNIKEAAIKAIRDGETKYTPVDGTPAIKKAIQEKFKQENSLNYELNQIIACAGAKMAIYLLCQGLLNAGDEAIIPAPYWVSYPPMVKLADATPVILNTSIETDYKISPQQLDDAINDKTRLFFLNNPSNPSGKIYSVKELEALIEVLLKHPNLLIMSDDIYEHTAFENQPTQNIVQICPALYDRTVVINGVSKAYAMTGWRIGYAAGPANIIGAMKKIQSQSTSNPCSIAQAATVEALSGDQSGIPMMVKAFKERHDYWINALKDISGFKAIPSDGTFYNFPNLKPLIDRLDGINTDIDLCEYLLDKAHVAMVPGIAFGVEDSARISFAVGLERLKEAVERIKKALA